jgi:hypothetical protein
MRWTAAALVCIALVLSVQLAHAFPTSLIWIPNTDIQDEHSLYLALSHYRPVNPGDSFTTFYATYGLSDRFEVGFDVRLDSPDPLSFNAKALLCQESDRRPALAVGLMGFGTEAGVNDYNIPYLLLAKTFGPVRVTAGYGHGKGSTLGGDADMLLLGIEGYLDRGEQWWWAVDSTRAG